MRIMDKFSKGKRQESGLEGAQRDYQEIKHNT